MALLSNTQIGPRVLLVLLVPGMALSAGGCKYETSGEWSAGSSTSSGGEAGSSKRSRRTTVRKSASGKSHSAAIRRAKKPAEPAGLRGAPEASASLDAATKTKSKSKTKTETKTETKTAGQRPLDGTGSRDPKLGVGRKPDQLGETPAATDGAMIAARPGRVELPQKQQPSEAPAKGEPVKTIAATDKTAIVKTAPGKTATDKTATDKTATDKTATDKTATGKTATDKTATGKTATGKTVVAATDKTAIVKTAPAKTATGKTAAAPDTSKAPAKQASTKAKPLAAPVAPPNYPPVNEFGYDQPVLGCFEGHVYAIPENSTALPEVYKRLEAQSVVYACEWDIPTREWKAGFPGLDRFEWFAIRYSGAFNIADAGEYNFRLSSDDGSRLYIDGELVVNNDGAHSPRTRTGKIKLKSGDHHLVLEYFQGQRYHINLQLFVTPPGGEEGVFSVRD